MSKVANKILNCFWIIGSKNSINNIIVRNFAIPIKEKNKLQDAPLYTSQDDNFKTSKTTSRRKLEELLDCTPYISREIVLKYKKFAGISAHNIGQNYMLCIKNGITQHTITNYPAILAESDLPDKLKEIEKLPHNTNLTVPLLTLSITQLKGLVMKEDDVPRIAFMSKTLEMDECKICEMLAKRPFLLSLDVSRIENNVRLLTGFGIANEDIVKDLWVLKYSTKLIEERLKLVKMNNLDNIKTWMVRAKSEILEKYIQRRSENKLILGENSITQYLSERLQCTEEIAKYLIFKHPALQNKSLKKMNEMIDFLYEHGFKPIHICKVPKILLHSVETTKKRLKELEAEGMQPDTLYILTKSQKQYMQYYESLVKTNKNKLKSC